MHYILFAAIFLWISSCNSEPDTSYESSNSKEEVNCPDNIPHQYKWIKQYDIRQSLYCRISLPSGYQRTEQDEKSFANWLRYLPLKQEGSPVLLYNGEEKSYQKGAFAVVDIDVGQRDLQQCADAVMRMRGEYLYSTKAYEEIHFNYTNGEEVGFNKYREGYEPRVVDNKVRWTKFGEGSDSHQAFRKYMNWIFSYAGTASLEKELKPIEVPQIRAGDVFIQGGFPGHAILVLDVGRHESTGEFIFLLGQSYMPAQSFHLLRNMESENLGPWHSADFGDQLETAEWTFRKEDLRRF